ncbi:MAG: imidazole glycerol phosphate synthase subunit HisH [Rikenellaceae bacterium]|jgi:glutamine amidotransferase|nr:imidazole glycerol phosphate synthase subunit HisH [Rikenellaceae bacterium]
MITIIDYGTGNLQSVINAFSRLGVPYELTADRERILRAEKVLLPGVGAARPAMEKLQAAGLDEVIRSLTQPVLGICLGMQLMCAHSEEGDTPCLGIFENEVKRFDAPGLKVPHMGWNAIYDLRSPLYAGIEEQSFVYFVHSYAVEVGEHTIATTDYGAPFSASLRRGNFYGAQFHPEKSGPTGERILENFLAL